MSTSWSYDGEIVGLIGPNGAGKTTFFNCLTGLYQPTSGEVRYRGTQLPSVSYKVTAAGVARTFQNIRLFQHMTALENVQVGGHTRTKSGLGAAIVRTGKFKREERGSVDKARELLEFVGLKGKHGTLARNLPYGDQRRLEIARALASDPGLLLLDEPTAGMNERETTDARNLVFAIRDRGLAVVVIEHDMRFIFSLCSRVAVLVQGQKLVEGTPEEVQRDPRVIAAYLGEPTEADETDAEVLEVLAAEERRRPSESPPATTRRGAAVTALLEISGLRVAYGKIEAVKGIDLVVEEGEVVSLIGVNGAGKTTTLRTISGLLHPVAGEIRFKGKRINGVPAHAIVEQGLAHSPEGRHIFPVDDDRGEPPPRCVHPPRQRGDPEGHRARVRPVPGARRAPQAARGDALRRRAADAGDGPRAHVPAHAAHARRAVDGPLADHDAEDHDDGEGAPAARHHDPAGRAERPGRASARAAWLRHGDRQDRPARHRRRPCSPTTTSARPTSARISCTDPRSGTCLQLGECRGGWTARLSAMPACGCRMDESRPGSLGRVAEPGEAGVGGSDGSGSRSSLRAGRFETAPADPSGATWRPAWHRRSAQRSDELGQQRARRAARGGDRRPAPA